MIGCTGFPATCPYVTSVGATQINPGSNVTQPEVACETVIYSGGGFSNHFAIPVYQKKAIQQYLRKYKPGYPPELWNSTGIVRVFFFSLLFFSDWWTWGCHNRVVAIQIYPRMGMILFFFLDMTSITGDLTLCLSKCELCRCCVCRSLIYFQDLTTKWSDIR